MVSGMLGQDVGGDIVSPVKKDPAEATPQTTPQSHASTRPRYTLGQYKPKEGYEDKPAEPAGDDASLRQYDTEESTSTIRFKLLPLKAVPVEGNILDYDVHLLHKAHHADPFAVLGPHSFGEGRNICVRSWVKDAQSIAIRWRKDGACFSDLTDDEGWIEMEERCEWLFQKAFSWEAVCGSKTPLEGAANGEEMSKDLLALTSVRYELRVRYNGDDLNYYYIGDTYNFGCTVSNEDLRLFQSGSCWHVDNLMGSHIITFDGCEGVRFCVWAPNAIFVSAVGDFNQWDGRGHPMRRRHEFGVWELFIPNIVKCGMKYGYRIHSKAGHDFIKIDPFAQEFENPPAHASVISAYDDAYKAPQDRYQWGDGDWMSKRERGAKTIHQKPMSIYEVHLPSWMRGDNNRYLSYRELAHRLIEHLTRMNFTHVEFLPLAHHPFEGSWGYQVSGLYAPYSRLGSADDLKYLIDQLHQHGFGVFIDFVAAHFVKDDWGLVYYDGEPCFEYSDPREGEHREWGTMVFNFRRNEVRSFLLGAAYHWLRRYHVDGLRIDAVSSMLYKNYCREDGDWVPNEYGGDANLEAINMLQELNWVIHRQFPGVFTMAEEATSWAGVTDKSNGLGFDAKWDLGWMNDTLSYLCKPADLRSTVHTKLTFRGLYAAHEKWVLPLSHDEVVSGKGSLLDKCGYLDVSFEDRIATMKVLYVYQIGVCGRPLIFMGSEFGQGREWSESRSLDWHESCEERRSRLMLCLSDILRLYKTEKSLYKNDDDFLNNFTWTECDNYKNSSVLSWLRTTKPNPHRCEEDVDQSEETEPEPLSKGGEPADKATDDRTSATPESSSQVTLAGAKKDTPTGAKACPGSGPCNKPKREPEIYEWYNDTLFICNFSNHLHFKFPIGVPHGGLWTILVNTDDWKYAGQMRGLGNGTQVHTTQGGRLGWPYCLWLDLPPFSAFILKAPQPRPEDSQRENTPCEKDDAKEEPRHDTPHKSSELEGARTGTKEAGGSDSGAISPGESSPEDAENQDRQRPKQNAETNAACPTQSPGSAPTI